MDEKKEKTPKLSYCPYCGSRAVRTVKEVPRCHDCNAVFFVTFSRYARRVGKQMSSIDEIRERGEIDFKWRQAWTKLSCLPEPGRLQVKQEKIERKALHANYRIANLMRQFDELVKNNECTK